jgi:hypothetical protein
MPENVKIIGKRNSEEKAPEKEDLESIREFIHPFQRRKQPELKALSLEDALKKIDNDWRFGKLGALAWIDKAAMEKSMKGFKVDEELTRSMKIMIRRVGRDILSKDEIKEAEERFAGAGSYYKVLGVMGEHIPGHIKVSKNVFGDYARELNFMKCHEPAHYVHFFIRMKQLEGGDIQDPIVKKLYDRMHNFYNNESIWRVESAYTGDYKEKIANAISLDVLISTNDRRASSFRELRGDVVWLEDLLHYNPKKFRELMEKPSLWVEADSIESLAKRLKREEDA